jgi:beta-phosphoglucomutase-like phosphatase (HAD superfamily)
MALVTANDIPHLWGVGIVDRQHVTIARSRGVEFVGKPANPLFLQKAPASGVASIQSPTLEGVPAHDGVARSPLTGWLIGVSRSGHPIEASIRRSGWTLAGAGLAFLLVGFVLATFLASRITRPMVAVSAASTAALTQDGLEGLSRSGVTEIAQLARAVVDVERQREVLLRRQAQEQTETLRRDLAHVGRVSLMGELSVSLAHELNQPLAAMALNAQEARRMLDGAGPSRSRLGVPVVTRAQVAHAKPDPDLFVEAAARLGVDVGESVVVGDSVWDLLAARRARALGVGLLSGGYGQDELERAGAYRVRGSGGPAAAPGRGRGSYGGDSSENRRDLGMSWGHAMVLHLDEQAVGEVLRWDSLIAEMESALTVFSSGRVIQPVRNMITIEEGKRYLGIMPAVSQDAMGLKLVSFYPGNADNPSRHDPPVSTRYGGSRSPSWTAGSSRKCEPLPSRQRPPSIWHHPRAAFSPSWEAVYRPRRISTPSRVCATSKSGSGAGIHLRCLLHVRSLGQVQTAPGHLSEVSGQVRLPA